MSTSRIAVKEYHVMPPSSLVDRPWAPPPTDEKAFKQASRVIALFKDIEAGRHIRDQPWTEFQLVRGEYEELRRQLRRNESLFGFVEDKIRYDYCGESLRISVRVPTGVHELFIDSVEDAIRSQLKVIRSGGDKAAYFAQKVRPARSTEIYFPVDNAPPSTRSKHDPDASFWHKDARYPGVIIEVVSSQKKKKRLARLAEDYLLDSNASVQVVVGLDVECGKKGSRKATLSVWRTHVVIAPEGDELRVVQDVTDEAFRDDEGYPTNLLGLRLQLKDFAHEELAQSELGQDNREVVVSAHQLCEYLDAAETMAGRLDLRSEHAIAPGLTKRKRPGTPPDQITLSDEASCVEQEERATKRGEEDNFDMQMSQTSAC